MINVAVLMTCHNRVELTKRCLVSLKYSEQKQNLYHLHYYVVDDGCTDGTGEMIKNDFPFVHYLNGNGNLFWNGGMHYAFTEAIKSNYDFYLWVNDDVVFYDGFLEKMLKVAYRMENLRSIITGYTLDKNEVDVSYGGQRIRKGIVPLDIHMILPTKDIEKCDTMHGNCVLIHNSVVEKIGVNDPFYTHGFGDIDYGLTASQNGIPVYLTNFPVGICESNPCSDRKLTYEGKTLIERFRIMNSWRQRPVKDWLHFTKKFGGKLWFIRFIGPYIKLLINKY